MFGIKWMLDILHKYKPIKITLKLADKSTVERLNRDFLLKDLFGELGSKRNTIPLVYVIVLWKNVSHKINNFTFDQEGNLFGTITVLHSPNGLILKDLIKRHIKLKPVIRGFIDPKTEEMHVITWDIDINTEK